jgi:hypothetical protein
VDDHLAVLGRGRVRDALLQRRGEGDDVVDALEGDLGHVARAPDVEDEAAEAGEEGDAVPEVAGEDEAGRGPERLLRADNVAQAREVAHADLEHVVDVAVVGAALRKI